MQERGGLEGSFGSAPFRLFLAASLLVSVPAAVSAETRQLWIPIGPDGGDVRSLAADPGNPNRIYLGTAGGALYRSETGGRSWYRLMPGFPRRNQNLDELVVSPHGTLFVGFWDVHARGGGVAVSADGGETFSFGLEGESVRALRIAPSDPKFVVAGSLSGVFLSPDGGGTWRRITPLGHDELRNVESVAIDPRDTGASSRHAGPPVDVFAVFSGDHATAPFTMTDLATDVLAVVDALNISSATFVGHSMGGNCITAI